jgi:zinc/manganese transport system substrate-binding protein
MAFKYNRSISAAALIAAALCGQAAAEPVKVVASFSILADLAAEIGGDNVEVATLVGPNGDAHVYEPSPADARQMAAADLVLVNGLGFEGWLERLIEASGYSGAVAVASEGVEARATGGEEHGHDHAEPPGGDHPAESVKDDHDGGSLDPHAWQSVRNAVTYVGNIAEALCNAEPDGCAAFRANAAAFEEELQALDVSIKDAFSSIPAERRKVITTHDSFGYFGQAYGIEFLAPQGVSTDAEASAADVARLIEQIREAGVTALFLENVSDPRLAEQIARETGVQPGGELFSDALSDQGGPAPTYIDMMRHNAGLLQKAMQGS